MRSADSDAAPEVCEPDENDSLIRWMLSLSPAERLQVLQGFVDSASELRRDERAEV
jgi:hypothetical protein